MADAKRHHLSPEQVHRLNLKHGWFHYRDAQSDVSRAFAEDAIETYERMRAAALDLLEALVWREQFEPRVGEDDNERFERIAEVFHRETGYLRPGKDCRSAPMEVRQQAWDAWMEQGRARVRAAIAKATGSAA